MNRVALGIVIVTAVGAVLAGRAVFGRIDRQNSSWAVAWLKTLVMVVGITFLVVLIPGWVMTLDITTSAEPIVADLIGTGVFSAGLGASLWLLWRAHQDERI